MCDMSRPSISWPAQVLGGARSHGGSPHRAVVAVVGDVPEEARGGDLDVVSLSGADRVELLAAMPDVSAVVDTRTSLEFAQRETFGELFLHLPAGARWIAWRDPSTGPDAVEPLVELATRMTRARRPHELPKPWREHARSAEDVRVTAAHVMFTKGRDHLLKVRDRQTTGLLRAREPELRVRVVERLEPRALAADDHDHGGTAPQPHIPSMMTTPPLEVRRYDGGVALPRTTLAVHGRSVLPDSFRWHLADVPTCSGIRDVGEHLAVLEEPGAVPEHLPGSYFHFGYNNPGHFGHLMTEAVARLWGWDAAKRDDPSLRLLCRLHPKRPQTPSTRLESQLLPAFGVDPDDIVWADRPVRVDTLYGCTPMWHNTTPFHAHPAITRVGDRIRTGLVGSTSRPDGPDRIFVTRRTGKRRCRNLAEVERIFARRGYAVVQPELLPLVEQVALFAGARVVAGFGGAGMFNLLYARCVEAVVVLNQAGYHARNEQLFAAVHDATCHTFWSAPDHQHPADGFDYRAHRSDWEFDLDAHAAELDELLPVL